MPDKPDQPWMPSRPQSAGASDRWVVLLVLGFCSVGVLAGCLVAFVVYWFLLRGPDFSPVAAETRDEKRAALAAAFSAEEIGVDDATLAPIRALFDRLQECVSDDDFRKLVDTDRFFRATIESDAMPPQPQFLYERYRGAARESVYRPWETSRYRLRRIEPLPNSEFVACGYFWDIHGDLMEMRWWLIKAGDSWKVYDWELLQVGIRRSRLLALYFKGPSDSYNRFYEDLNSAYDSLNGYEQDAGRAALVRAERWLPTIPEGLRAEPTVWAATYWCSLEEYDEAVRVASLLANPDDVPGVVATRLMQAHEHEQHEQVLEYCAALESALGPTPTAARYRAESLDKLGRRDEAAVAVGQLLELDPGGAGQIGRLALLMSADRIHEIVASTWSAEDQSAYVPRLAETLINYGDLSTGCSLATVVKSEAENSYIAGLCSEADGDDAKSADWFLSAMRESSHADRSVQYRHRYLAVMQRLNRIVEAYRAMPEEHADDAFAILLNQDEETSKSYLPPDQLKALIEAHKPHAALRDPLWYLAAGDLAFQEDETSTAFNSFRRGLELARAQDDESGLEGVLLSQLRAVQAQSLDGWRSAYLSAGDEVAACFAEVASRLSSAKRWDELAEMVEHHAKNHPDDLNAEYYRGLVAVKRGHPEDAETILASAQNRIETPPDQWNYQREQFCDLRIRGLLAADQSAAAYENPLLRPSSLRYLVPFYVARGDVEQASELTRRARADEPRSPQGWQWGAAIAGRAGNYAEMADLLGTASWSEIDFEDDQHDAYAWRMLAQQRFRCLLRLGRFDEAETVLQSLSHGDEDSTEQERIVLAAARGDVEEARRLLLDNEYGTDQPAFDDEDAASVLWSDAFRDVREQHPPHLTAYLGHRQWTLFLSQPSTYSTRFFELTAKSALGDDTVVSPLVSADPHALPAWLITFGHVRLVICSGRDRYTGFKPASAADYPDPQVLRLIRNHGGWVQVAVLSRDDVDEAEEDAAVSRLLRTFVHDDTDFTGLYDEQLAGIFPKGPEMDQYLAQELQGADNDTYGGSHYLMQENVGAVEETLISEWVRRPLPALALERYRGAIFDWKVTVKLSCARAAETVTIVVEDVEPDDYPGWTYIGRLTGDSQLHPHLRAGERVKFSDWAVFDWKIVTREGERHGRQEALARWDALHKPAPHDLPATSVDISIP